MEVGPDRGERAAFRPLAGWQARLASAGAAGLSGYALYWVLFIIQPQVYRVSFLLTALILTFMLYAGSRRDASRRTVRPIDWALIVLAVVALSWPLIDFERFVRRAAEPQPADLVLGAVTILLVLEATRRSTGWILPVTALGFLAYAGAGPVFDRVGLGIIAHRGYGIERLVGTLYMSLEGLFGVPLDVAATYIVLFTVYGAILEAIGAGTFFIQWALSASGTSGAAAAARSVTLAGFLLGSVSGSGVATTVMLGSVAWPVLRRAGYGADKAGAMLSAAGIGALLSPPTLGAAAFLIAEFLRISYLQVLIMATVPTILYYLSIFVMIEADANARPAGGTSGSIDAGESTVGNAGISAVRFRFLDGVHHVLSLVAIAAFMAAGMSAFRAVFWAMVLAAVSSLVRGTAPLTPSRLFGALRSGGQDVLSVAATTATAGIVVGVVTLTGLGLKVAGLIVALAGGTLVLTVVYSAIAVWILGLAVPVTASYIIAAVMVAPALTASGVPAFAAHMFIFYYAVLSEVSPPTALAPFAAAALTGGNPLRTMTLTWKYTLPAFVVPLAFTLAPAGQGILMRGSIADIASGATAAAAGTTMVAAAAGGWIGTPLRTIERMALGAAGFLVMFGRPSLQLSGIGVSGVVFILHLRKTFGSGDSARNQ